MVRQSISTVVVKSSAEVRWIIKGSKYPVILYTDYETVEILKSEDVDDKISRWQNVQTDPSSATATSAIIFAKFSCLTSLSARVPRVHALKALRFPRGR